MMMAPLQAEEAVMPLPSARSMWLSIAAVWLLALIAVATFLTILL